MVMSRLCFYSSFLLLLRFVAAQSSSYEQGTGFNPTTAIVMIVLVSVFFSLGCVSVYMRRCLEQALGIDDGRSGDPGNWLNVIIGRAEHGSDITERRHEVAPNYLSERPRWSDPEKSLAISSRWKLKTDPERPIRATTPGRSRSPV
ncbi:hypothetical protein F2Q69_00027340 [Brassica cretica]|uniref:Uncharacterized protein n=1 Tax=Brassica cretica TaxID=69181 RepID=A0A8S9S784_BRACR|nr:hypothetical protein F2Q69_00027340 [Brassica cretica]